MSDRTGQQLGNYRLVRLLGQGGFADVYLAEHIHLNSLAAIKVLQMRLTGNALEQFRKEGQSIARLVHPNIVRVFDFDVEDGIPFLVMDYAPNGTLRQRYPKGSILSAVSILPHFRQVALALQYAHDRKLIHRDIKPENMLLGANDEVLLSDFGLVMPVQSTGSLTTKEMAGTLPYMAPEQINGRPRMVSDQYALGIVLYEWLSGDRPFHGSPIEIATQHLMTPPAPLYEKVPGVSLALQEVVFTALAKEPLRRFASIQEFATAFENVALAESHSPSSVIRILAPMENMSSYPSSAPTHVNAPPTAYPQQSTAVNTPHPTQQPTAITPLSYAQLPTNMNTLLSPQQPFLPPTWPGQPSNLSDASQPTRQLEEADRDRAGGQPVIPATSDALPTRIISSEGYQEPRRRKGRVGLIILSLSLIITFVVSGIAFAAHTLLPKISNTTHLTTTHSTSATSATVMITPKSDDLKKAYTISAVIDTPDASLHQVQARYLSSVQQQSSTVNVTGNGTTPATKAQGQLVIPNYRPYVTDWTSGTTLTDNNGITIVILKTVAIPSNTTATVPAEAVVAGPGGNIAANDYFEFGDGQAATNPAPFTGGQNAQTYTFVQQSDIDGVANQLTPTLTSKAQNQIQVRSNERLIGSPECKPGVTSDHMNGDHATTVTVTVTVTCDGEAYDYNGAQTMASQLLSQQATQNLGASYVLVGHIATTLVQAVIVDANSGTIDLTINGEGIWAYSLTNTQLQAFKVHVAGKRKPVALTWLLSQVGIDQASIHIPDSNENTLPDDPTNITFQIQSVHGLP